MFCETKHSGQTIFQETLRFGNTSKTQVFKSVHMQLQGHRYIRTLTVYIYKREQKQNSLPVNIRVHQAGWTECFFSKSFSAHSFSGGAKTPAQNPPFDTVFHILQCKILDASSQMHCKQSEAEEPAFRSMSTTNSSWTWYNQHVALFSYSYLPNPAVDDATADQGRFPIAPEKRVKSEWMWPHVFDWVQFFRFSCMSSFWSFWERILEEANFLRRVRNFSR